MWTIAATVARKELRESLRDGRSLFAATAGTLAGPLVAGVVIAGRTAQAASANTAAVPPGLGALAVFLLVSVFIMGMSFANDSTAGERERGSLQPLLLTRASRLGLVVGKWLAVVLLNAVGFALTLACVLVLLGVMDLAAPTLGRDALGGLALRLAIVCVPLAFFAGALQLFVATHARTFKEGQTSLSMVLFWPMIAGMLLEFTRTSPAWWRRWPPVFAQHHLLSSMLRGESVSALALAASAAITLALAAALVVRTSVLLTRERIIFGR